MRLRGAAPIALWLLLLAAAALFAARARYIADMSAFLPAHPTADQQLLVDQLREGPASRVILIAVEGADAPMRARLSKALAQQLRGDGEFLSVENGAAVSRRHDRQFLFRHRYLLSAAVTPQRFTAEGLHAAIETTIDALTSPAGLWLKSLLPRDPTGEMLQLVEQLERGTAPRSADGVWVSAADERALLVAETRAAGSDTDAQQHALAAIRRAFRRAVRATSAPAQAAAGNGAHLRVSGPGVFAVAARAKIERAALRLSILGGALVITLLLAVYRSLPAVLLGLVPVVTGALTGVAAVALIFGEVQGVTLGFGITLIGEAVDYSIYFFIQSGDAAAGGAQERWRRLFWPTVRLGALTSICGFASLLPSGFPGLAQLGVYSISGLAAAAWTTRFVLPRLLPARLPLRNVAPLGEALRARLPRAGLSRGLGAAIMIGSLLVLWLHHGRLWNRDLAALSPISAADRNFDAALRADLGAADVGDIVVAGGGDLQAALRGAERAGATLSRLAGAGVIGGFDSPAVYMPSLATQAARRSSLPDTVSLAANLRRATAGLPLRAARLAPFLHDIAAARKAPALTPADLAGTSMALGLDELMLQSRGKWYALLPLHPPLVAGRVAAINIDRVRRALGGGAVALDIKAQADALYAGYMRNAQRASAVGFGAIALLLCIALRSPARAARVLAPLVLAVLAVTAALELAGLRLTILHLVGMLLIVAVGSNYALFFDRHGAAVDGSAASTIGSLAIANAATVIGFGLLSLSKVPVLQDLGMTVAPGAFLALIFSALLARRSAIDA
ncbi:MAG TPA: MMPL family transporter [Steroidobacteraceae bacterium]|nr:MMPL family transporter [Steroidobacteraceae bacterium]